MTVDELITQIRPDIVSTFGGTMTTLLITDARLRVASEGRGLDDKSLCNLFLDCIGTNDKFVGMLGAGGAKSKVMSWKGLVK